MSEKQKFERIVQKYCKKPFRVFVMKDGKLTMQIKTLSDFYGFDLEQKSVNGQIEMRIIETHPERHYASTQKWEFDATGLFTSLVSNIASLVDYGYLIGRYHVGCQASAKSLINWFYQHNQITKENRTELLNQLKTCKLTK